MASDSVRRFVVLVAVLASAALARPALAWGTMAHGFFTRATIDRLEGPLGDFFSANRDFLVCYSVLPDSWWGSVALLPKLPKGLEMPAGEPGNEELERHFFELDQEAYRDERSRRGVTVQPILSRSEALRLWQRLVLQRGAPALREFRKLKPDFAGGLSRLPRALMRNGGILPWVIQERLAALSASMRSGDWKRALFLATVLGHYVSDAHVPLHTAVDYDGKLSRNGLVKGIHGRWEARMLERNEADVLASLAAGLRTPPPPPLRPSEVPATIFAILGESHALAREVLEADDRLLADAWRRLARRGPDARKAAYTDDYFRRLYAAQGPVAKGRLWKSVESTALLWDLAWRMAGSPPPPRGRLDTPPLVVIDFKRDLVLPYDPATGPRE